MRLNTVEGAIVKVKDPMEYLKRLEFHKNSKNFEDYFFNEIYKFIQMVLALETLVQEAGEQ